MERLDRGSIVVDSTSFCGWLREFLPLTDEDTEWEVINAGGVSYASYRVASLMEELTTYEPDLFIVYTGHNEFLEERTYGDVRAQSVVERWLKTAAARTRIGATIHHLMADPAGERPSSTLPSPFTSTGTMSTDVFEPA